MNEAIGNENLVSELRPKALLCCGTGEAFPAWVSFEPPRAFM
jgi:hypothetical protein